MHEIRVRPISPAIGLLGAILSLAACTGSPAAPARHAPSPPPPVLHGRLVLQTEDFAIWMVSRNGASTEASRFAAASGAAALSPDGRTLVYLAGADLVFKDVGSGGERRARLAARPAPKTDCLRWSPDSSRVEYLDTGGALDVTTPAGRVSQIDKPKQGSYAQPGVIPGLNIQLPGTHTAAITVRSEITCGTWLDPHRIAFDRLTGAMPKELAPGTGDDPPVAPANTTAVALLGARVRIVNSASRWDPLDACGDRLLGQSVPENLGVRPTTYLATDTTTSALTGKDGGTGLTLSYLGPGDVAAAFVPGSCAVMVVDETKDPQGTYPTYRVGPGNASPAPVHGQPLADPVLFNPQRQAWSPEANPTVLAILASDASLWLEDLAAPVESEVTLPSQVSSRPHALLGWLP